MTEAGSGTAPNGASVGANVVSVLTFVYLAGALGALWSAMKPAPALLFLIPLALHALSCAFGADRARKGFGWFSFWAAMALASTVGAYAAAIAIAPPVTSDGHPVMPIGQVFISAIIGPIVGIALAYGFAKKVDSAAKNRDLILHGLFAVLAVIAIIGGAREWLS